MGRKWSIENILGWRTRFDGVRRWAQRCRECYDGRRCINPDDFVDFFLAYMVMSYSLRDFVIKTGGISQADMDELIAKSEPMRLCRDICNRGKHHTLTRPPSIDATWSLGREHIPWSDGDHTYFLIADGKKHDPLTLVRQCERFWEELINQGKFVEPANSLPRQPGEG